MLVALLSGFGEPPRVLRPLRDALRADGHEVHVAALGLNLDCGEATVGRIEAWLDSVADGRRVALVGHSRGGLLGRVIAVRRPDLVERLVTVVTPWAIGPPDQPGVKAVAGVIRALRRAGLPVMGSIDCATGDCCAQFRIDMNAKPTARWSALWSSTDRIAGEDGKAPRAADNAVDIRTGHLGAVTTQSGIAAIAAELR
ncbi:MAG TPA: alpha/beta hydrolase [Acidimicrobiales bacterium]|nr:alpha/beta hydrolase [Acidimicrobiales bacterium]